MSRSRFQLHRMYCVILTLFGEHICCPRAIGNTEWLLRSQSIVCSAAAKRPRCGDASLTYDWDFSKRFMRSRDSSGNLTSESSTSSSIS